MKFIKSIFVLIVSMGVFASVQADNRVIMVKDKDPEMLKAIARAKSTLNGFLAKHRKPSAGMGGFKLKVHIKDGNGDEHLWVIPFKVTKKGFTGTIANEPRIVRSVRFGQTYSFGKNDVSDWGYMHGKKQYGNYTTCVLLKRMPPNQAQLYFKKYGFQCN